MSTDDVPATYQPARVVVTLTPTDAGGTGVETTYFTTDGTEPTTSSSVYSGSDKPTLGDGEAIRYFSVDQAGNEESVKTSPAAKVDLTVPETEILTGPAAATNDRRPSITFGSSTGTASFECSLDGATAFSACTSPYTPATDLADGEHTLRVRGVNRAEVVDPTPAARTFTVDTVAPDAPTAVSGPPASSTSTTQTLSFTGEPGAVFRCVLDSGAEAPCTSPVTLTGLAVGAHTFTVTQVDAAGNTGPGRVTAFTITAPAEPTPPAVTPTPGPSTGQGPNPTAVPKPVISRLSLSAKRLRVGTTRTAKTAAAKKTRTSLTFNYSLSAAATTTLTIERKTIGRRVGKSCRAASEALARRALCTRYVRVLVLTRKNQKAGANSVRFTGRVGTTTLKPGSHRVTVVASNTGGRSAARAAAFSVVRR